MLALLVGAAPARAQDSPGIIPAPKQPRPSRRKSTSGTKRRPRSQTCRSQSGREPKRSNTSRPKRRPRRQSLPRRSPLRRRPHRKAGRAQTGNRRSRTRPNLPSRTKPPPSLADVLSESRRASARKSRRHCCGRAITRIGGDDPMAHGDQEFPEAPQGQNHRRAHAVRARRPDRRRQAHEDEFGWSVVVDPATGIRIGLPTKLVPHARDAAHGTRWSSTHGEVQVETFRIKEPGLTLAALFEREKKEPATRKVESSALHDDSFVITGMQGLKMFSVRAKMRDGEVARLHHNVRPDDGDHRRAGDGGDGQRVLAVSRAQRALCRAGELGGIRQRAGGERAGPYRHRPEAHAGLPGDRRLRALATPSASPRTRTTGSRCCAFTGSARFRRYRWRTTRRNPASRTN